MAFLRSLGHEVDRAAELGASRLDDAALARLAVRRGAVLLTLDLDFGEMFVSGLLPPMQVVLVRARSGRPAHLNAVLEAFLKAVDWKDEALERSLIVVTEKGHRVRRLG